MGITFSAKTIVNNLTIGKDPIYFFNVPTGNLILYLDASNRNSYPGTGTVWYDLSASGNTCYITGATFNTAGSLSNFSFNGTNNYVKTPTSNSSTFFNTYATTGYTISFWMKSTQTNGGTIYGETSSSDATPTMVGSTWYIPMIYLTTTGKIRIELFWGGGLGVQSTTGNITVNNNSYHNVTAVVSGLTESLYVDGVFDKSFTAAGKYNGAQQTLHWIGGGQAAGRGLGSNYYNGSIYNFIIYKKPLTQTEITNLYNQYSPRFR
jgi:hypothetical protein